MIKALVLKELREVGWMALLALGAYLAMVSDLVGLKLFSWIPLMPGEAAEVPFTGSQFSGVFVPISIVLAVALGFRQSAWEANKGTYLFLLHRPTSWNAVFLTKLLTGAALLVGCMAVPIVLYASWASRPGNIPSPFAWSMTLSAWKLCFLFLVLYLAAFLSGLRPARWAGTRLLPLIGCSASVFVMQFTPWWWTAGLLLTVVVCLILVAAILHVAHTRDYA